MTSVTNGTGTEAAIHTGSSVEATTAKTVNYSTKTNSCVGGLGTQDQKPGCALNGYALCFGRNLSPT